MLAAVGAQKRGLEALGLGHFLGAGPGPKSPRSGVPSALFESPRIPSAPGQQPGAPSVIPASSQQPANRKPNQRIPYARYIFTFSEDVAAPRELQDGDLVFVHKTSASTGRGHNRLTKCTGVPQLNSILADRRPGYTTLDFSGSNADELGRRILEVRAGFAKGDLKAAENRGATDAELKAIGDEIKRLEDPVTPLPTLDDVDLTTDWKAVIVLSEWTPDGVLYGVDDDALDVETPHDARDDGVLLNVAVQGPTPMRNTAWQIERTRTVQDRANDPLHVQHLQHVPSRDWAPQFVDDRPLIMDSVFVGLVAVELKDAGGARTGWAFGYKLFTGRQALLFSDGAPSAHGPTADEFRSIVTAWRIGRIMDTNAVGDAENRRFSLAVCIHEWPAQRDGGLPLEQRRRDFNWLCWEYGWEVGVNAR
jgi:hypothetical protein